jgi:hypothetical protein
MRAPQAAISYMLKKEVVSGFEHLERMKVRGLAPAAPCDME